MTRFIINTNKQHFQQWAHAKVVYYSNTIQCQHFLPQSVLMSTNPSLQILHEIHVRPDCDELLHSEYRERPQDSMMPMLDL